jgi:hypothetical protein
VTYTADVLNLPEGWDPAKPYPPVNYRTGRKLGRTVYAVTEHGDQLIGVMDTPELGAMVVDALNANAAMAELGKLARSAWAELNHLATVGAVSADDLEPEDYPGEHGPELTDLPPGSRVEPTTDARIRSHPGVTAGEVADLRSALLAMAPASNANTEARPWNDLRATGLLWLINRVVFHPRGYALGLVVQGDRAIGWQLLGDGSEPWTFGGDEGESFAAAQRTLNAALNPARRRPGVGAPAEPGNLCAYSGPNPGPANCGHRAVTHLLITDRAHPDGVGLSACHTHADIARASGQLVDEHPYAEGCVAAVTIWLGDHCGPADDHNDQETDTP